MATHTHIRIHIHTPKQTNKQTTQNGQKFDSSVDRGQPFSFQIGVGQVIRGWDDGVIQMSLGEKAVLDITPDFGYGMFSPSRSLSLSAPPLLHTHTHRCPWCRRRHPAQRAAEVRGRAAQDQLGAVRSLVGTNERSVSEREKREREKRYKTIHTCALLRHTLCLYITVHVRDVCSESLLHLHLHSSWVCFAGFHT